MKRYDVIYQGEEDGIVVSLASCVLNKTQLKSHFWNHNEFSHF